MAFFYLETWVGLCPNPSVSSVGHIQSSWTYLFPWLPVPSECHLGSLAWVFCTLGQAIQHLQDNIFCLDLLWGLNPLNGFWIMTKIGWDSFTFQGSNLLPSLWRSPWSLKYQATDNFLDGPPCTFLCYNTCCSVITIVDGHFSLAQCMITLSLTRDWAFIIIVSSIPWHEGGSGLLVALLIQKPKVKFQVPWLVRKEICLFREIFDSLQMIFF